MSEQAGIREVKKSLSHYIRKVKKGETITITMRGVPVAKLTPVGSPVPEGIRKMVDEGLASWRGGRPGQRKPVRKKNLKSRDLAEMICEDRR